MGEFTRQPARDIKIALIDSVLAGLCALIVFGPIVGVVLKGYGFTLAPARVAILVAVVMAGRLALSLLLQSRRGKPLLPALRGRMTGVRPAAGIPLAAALDNAAAGGPGHCLSISRQQIPADRGDPRPDLRSAWPGLNIVVGLAGLLDLGYVAFCRHRRPRPGLGYQYLGLGLGDAAAGAVMATLAGALLGFPELRAWRLPGHRHPRLWRNHSPGA